ncbi:MAG TPA: hypothetical protein VGW12_16530 [Pyrinomonadaceae bacterium]|nr:hypothetical protein [Pyrinomonadaceae bacterium]
MATDVKISPLTCAFTGDGAETRLELMNASEQTLRCVEVLTVFLKDTETSAAPSRAHIRFEAVKFIRPHETAIMSHKTLIDGKVADPVHDQLGRLKAVEGVSRPYVLDISWEDPEGKTRFQRIPVGR